MLVANTVRCLLFLSQEQIHAILEGRHCHASLTLPVRQRKERVFWYRAEKQWPVNRQYWRVTLSFMFLVERKKNGIRRGSEILTHDSCAIWRRTHGFVMALLLEQWWIFKLMMAYKSTWGNLTGGNNYWRQCSIESTAEIDSIKSVAY
jgi:hypothetical protein